MRGAGRATGETIVIKVLICAGSVREMQQLEEVVGGAASLELAGSCLGRANLAEQIAETRLDVVLERWDAGRSPAAEEPDSGEWIEANGVNGEVQAVPTVALVSDSEFPAAWLELQAPGSALRAILPVWASGPEIASAIGAAAEGLLVLHANVMEAVMIEAVMGRPADLAAAGVPLRGEGAGQALSRREGEILNLLAAGWAIRKLRRSLRFPNIP